uniref:Polynucleotide 5'-hydroxyl-kinase NOL9 n=1 Tax=Glossina palpalis gambiensis TaxID=67801 RepID=A0A1B0BE37_9MUSC
MHKNKEYSNQNSMPSKAHEQLKRKLQQIFKSKNEGPGDKTQERTNLMNYNGKKYTAGTLFLDQSPYAARKRNFDLDKNVNMDSNSANDHERCESKSTKTQSKSSAKSNKKSNNNKVGSSTSKPTSTLKKESNNSTVKGKVRQAGLSGNRNQIRTEKVKQQNLKTQPIVKKEKAGKNYKVVENKQGIEIDKTVMQQVKKEDHEQECKKRPLPAKMSNEPNKKVKIFRKKVDKSRNVYESDSETTDGCTDHFFSHSFERSRGGKSEGGRGDGPAVRSNVKNTYYYDDDEKYLYEENSDENEDEFTSDDDDDYLEDEQSDSDDDFDCISHSFESDQNETSYYFDSDDDGDVDYKPPKHFTEDLIIHKGTAYKRDLRPDDKVNFKMDICRAQIIELRDDEMDNLEETEESDYLGCEIHDISMSDSNDSWISIDINDKYTLRDRKNNNAAKEMEEMCSVDVIDASDCACKPKENVTAATEELSGEMCCDDKHQLPADKLSKFTDYNKESTVLITEFVDNASDTSVTEGGSTHATVSEDLNALIYNKLAENSAEERNQDLDHFRSIFCNAVMDNLVLVLLKDPFYIYGTIRLTLLTGNIDLYGHTPALYTELEVFSPRGCTIVEISPKGSEMNPNLSKDALIEFLKSYDTKFTTRDLKRLADTYNPKRDAVLLLKPNKESKQIKQQFKKFMEQNVFPNIKTLGIERPLYGSEYRLRCVINTSAPEEKCLRIPKEWQDFKLQSNSRVMIAGGKAVGKSTLLRFLINKFLPHLHNILLIDLDIGQPEIFVPQTVSCTTIKQPLIGPGFLLNLEPDFALAVGHINIVLCPHRYIHSVNDLIKYCLSKQEYCQIPWLINTMGYNKGFALELMSEITQQLMPTDVIQLQARKDINNFDFALFVDVLNNVPKRMFLDNYEKNAQASPIKPYVLHLWDSPVVEKENRHQKDWDMSAKDLRYANLLTLVIFNATYILMDVRILFSAPLHRLKLVNLLENVSYTREELIKAIEASLVYLCHYREDDTSLECCGVGVVRGIDHQIDQIYLVPATSITCLRRVNCLAIGEMPLPSTMFTYQGPRVKDTAPYVYNTVDANSSKSIKHFPRRLNETCFKKN